MKVDISYINFDELIHKEFPRILSCKIYEKDAIINMEINCSSLVNDINSDVCYDNTGKYIFISIGQWHNNISGEYISENDFYSLNDCEVHNYDYVEGIIKIYTNKSYKTYIHNFMDKKIKISLIPSNMLDFLENKSNLIFKF